MKQFLRLDFCTEIFRNIEKLKQKKYRKGNCRIMKLAFSRNNVPSPRSFICSRYVVISMESPYLPCNHPIYTVPQLRALLAIASLHAKLADARLSLLAVFFGLFKRISREFLFFPCDENFSPLSSKKKRNAQRNEKTAPQQKSGTRCFLSFVSLCISERNKKYGREILRGSSFGCHHRRAEPIITGRLCRLCKVGQWNLCAMQRCFNFFLSRLVFRSSFQDDFSGKTFIGDEVSPSREISWVPEQRFCAS